MSSVFWTEPREERDAWTARRRYERTTAPSGDVVTIAELKAHLKTALADDDVALAGYLDAATTWVEQYTGRSLLTQAWRAWFDGFPASGVLLLDKGPVTGVTSITTYDVDDTASVVTSTDYQVDAVSEPARVSLRYGKTWPTALRERHAVAVLYGTGYGTAASVPAPIRTAITMLAGYWAEGGREPVVVGTTVKELPLTIQALLAPYRLDTGVA